MLRVNVTKDVPKYKRGRFLFNENTKRFEFEELTDENIITDEYVETNGFKFSSTMNGLEEMIFRQEFQRSDLTYDSDTITVLDLINVVLFLAPTDMVTPEFVDFVHTLVVTRFLRALIVYFEYYLKMAEFMLIRRDQISGKTPMIQTDESQTAKRVFSSYLVQYRLLVAREYCLMLVGEGEMKPFYHITPIVNISKTLKDQFFYESLLAFSTQVVWIAMHRRAYDFIDLEMNRLFRSEHFKLKRYAELGMSRNEASFLNGKNYKRVNYRAQTSPLVQEVAHITKLDSPVMNIGVAKYRGSDWRIHQIEAEFLVPDSQLYLIGANHGILGHPKALYDTVLNVRWEAVRARHYTKEYDPYQLRRQPCLDIPKFDLEKMRRESEKFPTFFNCITHYDPPNQEAIEKWYCRDALVDLISKTEGLLIDIQRKCQDEVDREDYGPSVEEILSKFMAKKALLRKDKKVEFQETISY